MQIGPAYGEAKRVLLQFISYHLGATAHSFQCVYDTQPHDLILIEGPHGTTLAVGVDLLLLPHELAQAIVAKKIEQSKAAFERGIQ